MRVLLVRHGQTLFRLSEVGQKQILAAGNFLKLFFEQEKARESEIVILTSPLKRAVESAEILRKKLGLKSVEVKEWLDCGADTTSGLRRITSDAYPTLKYVIAVSHMPNIEEALSNFAMNFGIDGYFNASNGSVHLIDANKKVVQKIFAP